MTNPSIPGQWDESLIDLEALLHQVEASKAWFARRVLPLSLAQLRWRPEPRRWSIAECLDHLNITLGLYLPKIDEAIASSRGEGKVIASVQWHRPSEVALLLRLEPPVLVPAETPAPLVPAPAVDPDLLVDHFYRTRERYADAIRSAAGLDLAHIRIVAPIFPVIESLGGTLALMAVHDRRHMWQAENVRRAPRFPKDVFASGCELVERQ